MRYLIAAIFCLPVAAQTSRVCQYDPPASTEANCGVLNATDSATVKALLANADIAAAQAEVDRLTAEVVAARGREQAAVETAAKAQAEKDAATAARAALEAQLAAAKAKLDELTKAPAEDPPPTANTPTAAEMIAAIAATQPKAHPEAGRVMIVVNDNARAEEGTEGKGASIWAGEQYARLRQIPVANICHIKVSNSADSGAWDSWHMSFERYTAEVAGPVKACLNTDTKYIQTVYGVPSHVNDGKGSVSGSLDMHLAALRLGQIPTITLTNPNKAADDGRVLLVTRLDGPSVVMSVYLAVRAIQAERLAKLDGIAYVDARGIAGGTTSYAAVDKNFYDVRDLLVDRLGASRVVLDERQELFETCPHALFLWQWYLAGSGTEKCTFAPGAVSAHLESNTASHIRGPWVDGGWKWAASYIRTGITATWGATGEPGTWGYAYADILFGRMLQGATFGEAALKAAPYIEHAYMVFLGDGGYRMPPVR